MISRRVFLKNGGAGARQPRLRAGVPRAHRRGGAARAAQGADHDLPARRRRRPEHGRAVRRARLLRGAPEHRDRRGRTSPTRAVDLDGFFGLHPRLAPLKPLWDARQLAIVHACGSPDGTRSHFDAQDYMETATPGVKSTRGRLAEPLPARARARRRRRRSAPSRSRRSCRARCRASSRRSRSDRSASSASAPARRPTWCRRRSKREYAAAADRVLNRTGARGVRRRARC